jgi:hypothetical protein
LYPPKIEDGAEDPSVMPDERVKFDETTEWAQEEMEEMNILM